MPRLLVSFFEVKSFEDFQNLKQNYSYSQHFKFTCSVCGKQSEKSMQKATWPLICRGCSVSTSLKNRTQESKEKEKSKRKENILKKYGSEENFQNYLKEKREKTFLEKYGTKSFFETKEFKEKTSKVLTKEKRSEITKSWLTEEKMSEIQQKVEQSNLEKYGVKCTLELESVKEKSKRTCLEKYGVEFSGQAEEKIEKTKHTCLEKYGVECHLTLKENREKALKTIFEKYNVSRIIDIPGVIEKSVESRKRTFLEKYGVEHYSQTNEYKEKMKGKRKLLHRKYFYENIMFDSKWEIAYFIWLKHFNFNFEYQPNIALEYFTKDNHKHYYYPDFKVEGRLVEIKGGQFIKEGRLYNPYKKTFEDEKYECMIKNNVEIISTKEIEPVLRFAHSLNFEQQVTVNRYSAKDQSSS